MPYERRLPPYLVVRWDRRIALGDVDVNTFRAERYFFSHEDAEMFGNNALPNRLDVTYLVIAVQGVPYDLLPVIGEMWDCPKPFDAVALNY